MYAPEGRVGDGALYKFTFTLHYMAAVRSAPGNGHCLYILGNRRNLTVYRGGETKRCLCGAQGRHHKVQDGNSN